MTEASPATVRRSRIPRWVFLGYCAVPVAAAFVFLSYAVRARIALGRWPEMYNPDPKDLHFYLHHDIVGIALVVGFGSVALLPFIAFGSTWLPKLDRRLGFALMSVGWLLFLLVLHLFIGWYLD